MSASQSLHRADTPLTQVEWTALAERKPLSDANVIYVIHDHEPFSFTHQGTSWADMGSTHHLPYPYDPKCWAVTNNVPVICNEFGASDGTSNLEDRARYLTDVISILEELEIP